MVIQIRNQDEILQWKKRQLTNIYIGSTQVYWKKHSPGKMYWRRNFEWQPTSALPAVRCDGQLPRNQTCMQLFSLHQNGGSCEMSKQECGSFACLCIWMFLEQLWCGRKQQKKLEHIRPFVYLRKVLNKKHASLMGNKWKCAALCWYQKWIMSTMRAIRQR